MDARALLPGAASSPPEALGGGQAVDSGQAAGKGGCEGSGRAEALRCLQRPLRPCRRTIRRPLRGSRVGGGIEGPPEGDKQRQRPIAGLETLMSYQH